MDIAYAHRLFGYVLWNEALTGQSLESIRTLAISMGIRFPEALLDGEYYLVATGYERRAYRSLGIDAITYDRQTYAFSQDIRSGIADMGYASEFAMHIYDDTKRLIFILSPRAGQAAAPLTVAEHINAGFQRLYREQFLGSDRFANYTVLSDVLSGWAALSPAFRELCELHQCGFFQLPPFVVTQRIVDSRRQALKQDETLWLTGELSAKIENGDQAGAQALLKELFLISLRHGYNLGLCYGMAAQVVARLTELCDEYGLDPACAPDGCNPHLHPTIEDLFHGLSGLLDRVLEQLRTSKRHFSPMTRMARIYIGRHHREPLTLGDIAAHVGVAPGYLSRVFNREVGESIPSYLTRIRVQHTTRQLCATDRPIKQIAQEAGFLGASYFSRIFKEIMGLSPKAYRDKARHPKLTAEP